MQQVELVEVSLDQKFILRQLIELYEYDFSEYNDRDVNEYGQYGYKYLDHYWTENDRHPFFIKVDQQYAGFVLINSHSYLVKGSQVSSVAEFFIMRKYRGKGIGRTAATSVFDRYRGNWEVLQHGNNQPSKRFWHSVIDQYTDGHYELLEVETESWRGQGFVFNNEGKL
ncbi:GNAT family N-acetyltransferase [Paenibacillus septentrionalis]|uniref:GNAT family N-acetyltransferase n=1 Tax=Paenibacillus septentrionalis TaxID=429342 RepID=A0ABW1V2I3_9BACL